MIDWNKNRQRELRKRAIVEEISDQQQAASLVWPAARNVPSKADLRVVCEEVARQHAPDPKGAWVIFCECGRDTKFRIALSVALDEPLKCPNCGDERWLTEEDLRPPWEEEDRP